MRKKMRTRKSSLLASLVLALSLALSPVSAFAEELDTPVHEDPIDEIQYTSGSFSKNFTVSFQSNETYQYYTLTLHVEASYNVYWTEGITMSGGFTDAVITISNVKVNGSSAPYNSLTNYVVKTNNKAYRDYQFGYMPSNTGRIFCVQMICDEYGDVSINAFMDPIH